MRIAMYVNEAGEAAGFYEPGAIKLYEGEGSEWKPLATIALALGPGMSLAEVRERVREAARGLEGCKVLMASEIKGVPYTIFEGLGFNLWKARGKALDQAEQVRRGEEEARLAAMSPPPGPSPVGDLRDGFFRVDLSEIQRTDARYSSREILMPFLNGTTFDRLEILCDHPPRWLGRELEGLRMRWELAPPEAGSHGARIIVRPT